MNLANFLTIEHQKMSRSSEKRTKNSKETNGVELHRSGFNNNNINNRSSMSEKSFFSEKGYEIRSLLSSSPPGIFVRF